MSQDIPPVTWESGEKQPSIRRSIDDLSDSSIRRPRTSIAKSATHSNSLDDLQISRSAAMAAVDLTHEDNYEERSSSVISVSSTKRKFTHDNKLSEAEEKDRRFRRGYGFKGFTAPGFKETREETDRNTIVEDARDSEDADAMEELQTDDPIVLSDDEPHAIDLDDIVSSDDEIQITGARRCLKTKRKQKIRHVMDSSRPTVPDIKVNGVRIQEGSGVEFEDETFMRVCTIYPDHKHEFILVGHMFTRIAEKEILMPRLRDSIIPWGPPTIDIAKLPLYLKGKQLINEVCQRIKVAEGEADHDMGLWRRSSLEVRGERKIVLTNQPYEENSTIRQDAVTEETERSLTTIKREGPLICRWKETIITDEFGRVREHSLQRPTKEEILPDNFSTEAALRKLWRGPTRNLYLSKTKPVMADIFCGAGGMSSGAVQAGMDVKLALDHDTAKAATHELNFPDCDVMQVDINAWIRCTRTNALRVDVLHLSPPCQPFSPANTTPNLFKNETNQAVLLACGETIANLRPRIVTIEESSGLTNRHGMWFGALVSQLTELGFSVRWACLKCSDFGVPQTRTRVFLIASAPGEALAAFPKPTHAPGSVSVQTMLDDIAAHHEMTHLSHHDPASMPPISKPPYDAQRLAKCITCKGGDDNYHPSGLRPFTIRELLALQTFCHSFRYPKTLNGVEFTKTEMKVQCGNAVPPLMGKAIMRSVLGSLIATDKRRLLEFGGGGRGGAANPIEL